MALYHFINIKNQLTKDCQVYYQFSYKVLTRLNILPKEINLWIVEYYIDQLKQQLKLVDDDETLYLLTCLSYVAGFMDFGYEDYHLKNPLINQFMDDTVYMLFNHGHIHHIDNYVYYIDYNDNLNNLIKEVRLYKDVVLSHIKENLNEWGTNYINRCIIPYFKNTLYLNLL